MDRGEGYFFSISTECASCSRNVRLFAHDLFFYRIPPQATGDSPIPGTCFPEVPKGYFIAWQCNCGHIENPVETSVPSHVLKMLTTYENWQKFRALENYQSEQRSWITWVYTRLLACGRCE